jgi:hypothetical protein
MFTLPSAINVRVHGFGTFILSRAAEDQEAVEEIRQRCIWTICRVCVQERDGYSPYETARATIDDTSDSTCWGIERPILIGEKGIRSSTKLVTIYLTEVLKGSKLLWNDAEQ